MFDPSGKWEAHGMQYHVDSLNTFQGVCLYTWKMMIGEGDEEGIC